MDRYQDKKVVILGGTSGMGLATAKMLIDEGARVLVTGRSQAGLQSAREELGTDAIVVSSDARSLTDIDALAAQVKTKFDTIDLLFVNAGFSIPTPLANVTEAIYDEMFNLNAKGPFFAVQKLPPLINREALSSSRAPSPTSRDCPAKPHTEPPRLRCGHSPGCSPPSCFLRTSASTRCRPAPSKRASSKKCFPRKRCVTQVKEHTVSMIPDEALRDLGGNRQGRSLPRVRRDLHDRLGIRSMVVGRSSEIDTSAA